MIYRYFCAHCDKEFRAETSYKSAQAGKAHEKVCLDNPRNKVKK